MRNVEALFCTIGPMAGGQNISKAVSIPSFVRSARDGLTQNGNFYCRAPPPVCLPSVYLMQLHVTRSPRTVSDQILEVGTAWERGYLQPGARFLYVYVCVSVNTALVSTASPSLFVSKVVLIEW